MSESVFNHINNYVREEIIKLAPLKEIKSDAVIVYEGQSPNVALFIYKGMVKINQSEYSFDEKNSVILLLNYVLSGAPSVFSVEVKKGASVAILDRILVQKLKNKDFFSALEVRFKTV